MTHLLNRLWPREEGQSLPEYALLLFLISLTAVTAMAGLATKVSHAYNSASTHVKVSQKGSVSGGSLTMGGQIDMNKLPARNDKSQNPD